MASAKAAVEAAVKEAGGEPAVNAMSSITSLLTQSLSQGEMIAKANSRAGELALGDVSCAGEVAQKLLD